MKTKEKKPAKKLPGMRSEQSEYIVDIKYSPRAVKNKLIKFTVKKGKDFEISSEKIIELLSHYVNSEQLAPTFVDTEKINVVYVKRNLKCRLDKDMKAGDEINIEYNHPYPLEFALLEEAYNLAVVDKSRGAIEITPDMINKTKKQTSPSALEFLKKFYKSFINVVLGKST